MSLLSYTELLELQASGVIVGSDPELINSTSIDIRLGAKILFEADSFRKNKVSLKAKTSLNMVEYNLEKSGPVVLSPGTFCLAQSIEIFNLPNNISAEYKLKSSMARIGLEHLNAGWCDAGWHGSVLTLELKNMTANHEIELNYGDKIGQIVFFRHQPVPADKSYAVRGRYNKDIEVSGAKKDPIRTGTGGSDGC